MTPRQLFMRIRRPTLWAGVLLVPLLTLAIILTVVLGRFLSDRSIIVEAETTAIELTFAGTGNAWLLEGATVCMARAVPDMRLLPGDGLCDERMFSVGASESVTQRWPEGSRARLTLRQDGILEIAPVGLSSLPQGSMILIPGAAENPLPALAFDAEMVLGREIGSGERGYLLSGRYEIREGRLLGSARNGMTVIRSGDLARGDVIRIIGPETPAKAQHTFGHITPVFDPDRAALHVVALSGTARPQLEIGYHRGAAPTVVRTTWIDSVIASPLLLALTILLAVITNGLFLMIEGRKLLDE